MKPTELDLNLDNLRANANRKLFDAVRDALQHCDDIEAMARVLHSQAAEKIRAVVGAHTNGGGNNHAPKMLRGPYKKQSPRTHGEPLREAAILLINKAGPDGVDSIGLESELRNAGMIPHAMAVSIGRSAVNRALKEAVKENRIRYHQILGRNGRLMYYPGTSQTAPPDAAANSTSPGQHNGRTEKLRTFLTTTLLAQPKPISVGTLHQTAIEVAGFDKKWGNGDTLRNQIGRLMRLFVADGKVKRHGNGRAGFGGIPYTYTVIRPKVSVTKNGN